MRHYQAIVIGCGGLSCASLYRLAGRPGPRVLGIEPFRLGHERGSSQDHSRIIRLAQHQPQYAALAPAARTWTNQVLADYGVRLALTVTQEQVTYYATTYLKELTPEKCLHA